MKHKLKVNTSKGGNAFVIGFFVIISLVLALVYNQQVGWGNSIILDVLAVSGFVLLLVALVALLIFMNRVAILDEEGVTFKNVIKVLGAFKWSEVTNAVINEKTLAPDKEGRVRKSQEIVITTDGVVEIPEHKMKSPYTFIYSKEHQRVLLMYLEQQTSGLDLASFRREYSSN